MGERSGKCLTGSQGGGEQEDLICTVCEFLWYKYHSHGHMNVELGKYGHNHLDSSHSVL